MQCCLLESSVPGANHKLLGVHILCISSQWYEPSSGHVQSVTSPPPRRPSGEGHDAGPGVQQVGQKLHASAVAPMPAVSPPLSPRRCDTSFPPLAHTPTPPNPLRVAIHVTFILRNMVGPGASPTFPVSLGIEIHNQLFLYWTGKIWESLPCCHVPQLTWGYH
jgi:hypothetical protein